MPRLEENELAFTDSLLMQRGVWLAMLEFEWVSPLNKVIYSLLQCSTHTNITKHKKKKSIITQNVIFST